MKPRESADAAEIRWEQLRLLQSHYAHFVDFLHDGMELLGFDTTDIQEDIGNFMAHGPQYLMVQAQRSQAKTTIAALFAVWCLIHNPEFRVLIVSAGGAMAQDISILITRVILTMPELECMRPDKAAGDRTAGDGFDIHHSLKGLDKSASVACIGIDSNMQGRRADLLIPDDVESSKNGATPLQRAKLLHLTKDFSSICQKGRILWLGTPQTMESIYNALPQRGVTVRIWPGRYPTVKQVETYGDKLAPLLLRRIAANPSLQLGGGLLGDQGHPIDPVLLGEAELQKKERDQGTPYFQLQHMLNTALLDALKFPIKLDQLTVLRPAGNSYPLAVVRGMDPATIEEHSICDHSFKVMRPHDISKETAHLQSIWAYVDPAAGGANGDETAYAIAGFLNGNVWLLSCGGVPGGYHADVLEELAKRLARFKLDGVTIEKNMGYGAFKQIFQPILQKHIKCQVDEELVTGQKEARIINTLTPVIGRGALIIHPDVFDEDRECCERYAPAQRMTYSLFYQLAKVTMQRDALIHDDRADAVEGVVRHFQEALAKDQDKEIKVIAKRQHEEWMKNPMGYAHLKVPVQRPNLRARNRR